MTRLREPVVGRFAPSPTGELHFGSLVAALGSALSARSRGGQWLVRVEDIDPPREIPGSAQRILDDLRRLGLVPDAPVLYQSTRLADYHAAIDALVSRGQAFPCGCTRADLPDDGVYPGTCRDGLPPGRDARTIRARVDASWIGFDDPVHGPCRYRLTDQCGDFVIRRADGMPAYQLAVVVDDAFQGVTEVVRGADLLDSTARQVHLQRLLGLPTPRYLHLPLVVDADGRKLSKQDADDPVASMTPLGALRAALQVLGQPIPAENRISELIRRATAAWNPNRVPDTANAVTPN